MQVTGNLEQDKSVEHIKFNNKKGLPKRAPASSSTVIDVGPSLGSLSKTDV